MATARILMAVGPGGEAVETKVEGAPGPQCARLSEPYIRKIGGSILADDPTAEMGAACSVGDTAPAA